MRARRTRTVEPGLREDLATYVRYVRGLRRFLPVWDDMIREFNLTMDEALEVSDHMPIWAEFTVREGGQPGRVATRPAETAK